MLQTILLVSALLLIPTVDNPAWTGNFSNDTEQMILARAIYGEARGEPYDGMVAVAWSIRNRVENPSWWPSSEESYFPTYSSIILEPGEYAVFGLYDENRPYVENPSLLFDIPEEEAAWRTSYAVAGKVMNGEIPDNTYGADSFESSESRGEPAPEWATPDRFTVKIGNHKFYKVMGSVSTPTPSATSTPSTSPTATETVTPTPTVTPLSNTTTVTFTFNNSDIEEGRVSLYKILAYLISKIVT